MLDRQNDRQYGELFNAFTWRGKHIINFGSHVIGLRLL